MTGSGKPLIRGGAPAIAVKTSNERGRLISAAPLESLAARVAGETALVSRRAPHSDAASMLASFSRDLEDALHEARNVDVFLALDELAARTRVPLSTLRRRCARLGPLIGATKSSRSWIIHWPTYEAYTQLNGGWDSEMEAS